jgi:hypothetical protein
MKHIEDGLVALDLVSAPPAVDGQWLKGVGGAAVWAGITQADVQGLTAALAAKQATSEKAQVNGYPSLDATGKVPAAQLPPTAYPAYTAYTPTWSASGTAPAIGNATVVARYVQIGKLVHAWGQITFGSTTTFGTGNYLFVLPVAPSASLASQVTLGPGDIFDTSASAKAFPTWEIANGSNVWMIYPATWPFGNSSAVSQTTPWTWAVGDVISWNLTYEAA